MPGAAGREPAESPRVSPDAPAAGSAGEVFRTFLHLGLTSFGGPIAHIGYFRRALVEQRRWVSDGQFAQLLAICQFLPGPSSSQLGFSLGLLRAGWTGALAAFVAFTLPSAVLLVLFASLLPWLGSGAGAATLQGLKIVAFAVVADGVLGMARKLCPDATRGSVAVITAVAVLLLDSVWAQVLVVLAGAAAGLVLVRGAEGLQDAALPVRHGLRLALLLLGLFALLLLGLPLLAGAGGSALAVADAFYRAGALVFGGGHVVLPLLETSVVDPGWLSQDTFLAGYGAAQAIPGPMFAFAAYLGALIPGAVPGVVMAAVALLAIFLPGLLLVSGVLPLWHRLSARPAAARLVAGVNAAVVGLLGAALYDPIFVSGIRSTPDLAIGLVAFAMLALWRWSALVVVVWCVLASLLRYAVA